MAAPFMVCRVVGLFRVFMPPPAGAVVWLAAAAGPPRLLAAGPLAGRGTYWNRADEEKYILKKDTRKKLSITDQAKKSVDSLSILFN